MYYGHLWVDHKTFDGIRLFADWNDLSLKSAVHQLIIFGLNYYAIAQLRLERVPCSLTRNHQYLRNFTPWYAISNYLTRIYQKRKETP